MKPIQFLLVGFPYSGKSTLANELKIKLDFAVINIGQLKFDKGFTDVGDDDVPDKIWDEIFLEADKLILRYLRDGKHVANEYAWISKEWRNRAKKIASDAGFETKIIFIDISIQEIKSRWERNKTLNNRFQWPEEEIKRYLVEFEKPTDDEQIIIYNQSFSADEWINDNIISLMQ
jgi:predicted kinase